MQVLIKCVSLLALLHCVQCEDWSTALITVNPYGLFTNLPSNSTLPKDTKLEDALRIKYVRLLEKDPEATKEKVIREIFTEGDELGVWLKENANVKGGRISEENAELVIGALTSHAIRELKKGGKQPEKNSEPEEHSEPEENSAPKGKTEPEENTKPEENLNPNGNTKSKEITTESTTPKKITKRKKHSKPTNINTNLKNSTKSSNCIPWPVVLVLFLLVALGAIIAAFFIRLRIQKLKEIDDQCNT